MGSSLRGSLACIALGAAIALSGCHHQFGDGGDGTLDFATAPDLAPALTVTPANPVITITPGMNGMPGTMSTLNFTATVSGQTVPATWLTNVGDLGSITNSGTYTTSGLHGGVALIQATYNGLVGSTNVTVQVIETGAGDPNCATYTAGPGGWAGVGGNGPGCVATSTQVATLMGTATADPTVSFLYPYDKTVFPKGQLAPLLMWNPGMHNFDSLRLQMSAKSNTYTYDGSFAAPVGAPKATPAPAFVNMPIPQDVWKNMNNSASGDDVTVTVTFGEGANAVGPISMTWTIAAGSLKGIVYYNSYGTSLVSNSGENDAATPPSWFGAATLSINPGKTDPLLVAGTTSTADNSGCRVCHSVSKQGNALITQTGPNYEKSKLFALSAGSGGTAPTAVESAVSSDNSPFQALYPDASLTFTGAGGMQYAAATSGLYSLPSGNVVTGVTGLPADLQAALPSFAPDGSQIVFNWYGGGGGDKVSLATMSFNKAQNAFGPITKLFTPPQSGAPAVWPSFLPDTKGVVFEVETKTPNGEWGYTRSGNTGELWWVDTATGTGSALNALNGIGYLPSSTAHTNDQELNYEPTVNPVVSGGYAWVVFTSRRLYGNVATIDPFLSDPRDYNWKAPGMITTKKLWVAAIDINAAPGTDPSHPAFYLPAQELRAGNARGFWTVDPCQQDGTTCDSGDECCGGYCEPVTAGSTTVYECTAQKPTCSAEYEKCTMDSDCCPTNASIDPGGAGALTCINGYCGLSAPVPIL